jgi:hypothetical protein
VLLGPAGDINRDAVNIVRKAGKELIKRKAIGIKFLLYFDAEITNFFIVFDHTRVREVYEMAVKTCYRLDCCLHVNL